MRRTIINEYLVLMTDGNRIILTASNLNGAKQQASHIKGVCAVARMYKNGQRAECPW